MKPDDLRKGRFFVGEYLRIDGGRPLFGKVSIPAAKNSVLPILAASLLCEGTTELKQIPDLADVRQSLTIFSSLGGKVEWENGNLRLTANCMPGTGVLPKKSVKAMRSSVFYLAPALYRFGKVQTPMPGGCKLGPRPIDIHLEGLSRMGARVEWQGEQLVISAPRGLRGMDYALRLPSVGATETLLMAAVQAKGETILRGVAKEPEIVDLANYLTRCGAQIEGAGSSVIRVKGQRPLKGCEYAIIPDRITAATVAAAVASTGGRVEMENCPADLMRPVLTVLEQAGCKIQCGENTVLVERSRPLKGVGRIYTGVYPAFSTDAAPVVAAALLCASGRSAIEDTIFENRFACADGFSALGANACRAGRAVEIQGVWGLSGACVYGTDLRGSAALVVAALAARGESKVYGVEHIRRGYGNLAKTLQNLGARIELCMDEETKNEG